MKVTLRVWLRLYDRKVCAAATDPQGLLEVCWRGRIVIFLCLICNDCSIRCTFEGKVFILQIFNIFCEYPLFFCHLWFCRKTDKAVTVSSPKSFWRTTTRRWRTSVMRAGTWLSLVGGVHGRAHGHASTNVKSTSWRGCQRGTSPPIRATTGLLTSSTTLSVKGLSVRDTRQRIKRKSQRKRRTWLDFSSLPKNLWRQFYTDKYDTLMSSLFFVK